MVPVFLLVSIGVGITKRVIKVQVKKSKTKKYIAALEATNTEVSQETESYDDASLPAYTEKESASVSSNSSQYSSIEQSELIGSADGKLSSLDIDFSKVTKIVVNHGKLIHYISFMDASGNAVYKIGQPRYAREVTVISLPDPTELISQIKCTFQGSHLAGLTFITNKTRVETAGSAMGNSVDYKVPANSNIVAIESYCSKTIHNNINGLRFISATA